MILSEISIKRPVFALVMSILLLIFGIFCFWRLPVRELPDIDYPSLTIVTTYSGASPEVMESRVTRVIENELSGVSGITKITSNSRNGRSWISIEFKSSKNMLEAVKIAKACSSKGDHVLLSPACASLDMYKDFEERGKTFIKNVLSINQK